MSLCRSVRSVPLHQLHSRLAPQLAVIRSFSSSVGQRRDAHHSGGSGGGSGGPLNFFGRPRLPTNKGIMFVPQQEAWVGY